MPRQHSKLAFILLLAALPLPAQPTESLAPTPPMGWNSWDAWGMTIDEAGVRATADYMAQHLKSYGWQYVVVDEGWFIPKQAGAPFTLTADGRYTPAPDRYPSAANGGGFKPLADYVHSLGLKFGIHLVRGIPREAVANNVPIADSAWRAADVADTSDTCPWNADNFGIRPGPAGQAYYDSVARLFAGWGIDFLKVDCISDHPYKADDIRMISLALQKTGRPIVLSLSPGPTALDKAGEVREHAQMWRISDDFWDHWGPWPNHDWSQGLLAQFASAAKWAPHGGPGHWPDADMMPIGYLGPHPGEGEPRPSKFTHDEERTLVTLWSIARSPLMMGGNLTSMDAFTLSLLTNPEVLAVNQHSVENRALATTEKAAIWHARPSSGPGRYMALFNLSDQAQPFQVPLSGPNNIRDLWERKDLAPSDAIKVTLAPHASALYLVTGVPSLPRIESKDGRHALFVDGAPYLMLGAQVNNSSAWTVELPKVWPAIEVLHANTVEMPIYWEQFEPQPGQFDYSVMDTLLAGAREHKLHLVLLWFGTWKNGSSHYLPEWMKLQPERYPLMIDAKGRPVDSPSPFAEATLQADIRAFTALMSHLKEADPRHTVLMVQVENEAGTWQCVRDYSPAAQKAFEGPVPAALLSALHKPGGAWQQVFGDDAEEFFHAWSVAHYIEQVAAAGNAVYPLPLYANAALRDPLEPGRPPRYESGGPTDNVIAIWKAAAPSLNLVAPDIYMSESAKVLKVLDLYHRPDNALLVPEIGNSAVYAHYFFAALGHQAIGFSPFGMDYTGYVNAPLGATRINDEALAPFALNYSLAGPMQREIARLNFEGKLQAVSEEKGKPVQTLDFGPWQAVVKYGLPQFGPGDHPQGNPEPVGGALIAELGGGEFLVSGIHCRVDFEVRDAASGKRRQFVRVEEGTYEEGVFQPIRIWNGDQTDWGLNLTSGPQVLRVRLGTY
ncbi:MAG: DUF5597 domain-containing protein [Bryobacteraceae bacterium]